jgi:Fic family protein
MMSFRPGALDRLALPMATGWLLSDIAESKGRQQLFARQAPQLLRALREAVLIQSVESSNRIEGITVAADRLRPLVIGGAKPRDRSEEDIRGYRDALTLIHTKAADLAVTSRACWRC